MSAQRRLQPRQPAQVEPAGSFDSPYLTPQECLVYLRLNSLSALYRCINTQGLPTCRFGRRYRFDRREIDAWLRGTTVLEQRRLARKSA